MNPWANLFLTTHVKPKTGWSLISQGYRGNYLNEERRFTDILKLEKLSSFHM